MKDLEKHWEPTLQALAYWIAYKKEYYSNSLMPEGAIVAELTQLLSANTFNRIQSVDCERMYKRIAPKIDDETRADIVVGGKSLTIPKDVVAIIKKDKMIDKTTKSNFLQDPDEAHLNLKSKDISEVIEVKRYEPGYEKIIEDMEKLHRLKEHVPNIRRFLVVVSQRTLPKEIFTSNHNVQRSNLYSGKQKIKALARLGKKAYSSKVKSEYGAFAALIEII